MDNDVGQSIASIIRQLERTILIRYRHKDNKGETKAVELASLTEDERERKLASPV